MFFTNLGAEEEAASLELLRSLRDAGVAAEIYPECGKMKKQMEYANRRSIPYVVIIGSQELEAQAATVKDMRSGEQRQVPFAALGSGFGVPALGAPRKPISRWSLRHRLVRSSTAGFFKLSNLKILSLCVSSYFFFTALFALPLAAQETGAAQQLRKLMQVYRYLDGLYVDEVEMGPLVESAIEGMLEELDPHSAYIGAEDMKGVQESFDGEFSGIGIEFNVLRDTVIVVNTIVGGPAERVGVMPNDRIVRIDTLDAVGFKQTDVPKHLRGKTGTRVEIDVVRHGEPAPLHFVIVRDKIPLNTVDAAYMAADGVGYIKVNRFGRTTMSEFREAFDKLGRPESLILDLRGNGGGLLEQAVEMAGFFLPRGALVVSTEGRAVPPMSLRNPHDGEAPDGPLAVLIDENSASASEIVAGAVQDWDRGVVVGRPSFGKGLVQRQIGLGDGSAVRITVARYHTPSGRVIQRPYEKGKRREYYLDHLRRYDDAVRGFARRRGAGVPDPAHGPHGLRGRRHPSRRHGRSRYCGILGLLRQSDPPRRGQ